MRLIGLAVISHCLPFCTARRRGAAGGQDRSNWLPGAQHGASPRRESTEHCHDDASRQHGLDAGKLCRRRRDRECLTDMAAARIEHLTDLANERGRGERFLLGRRVSRGRSPDGSASRDSRRSSHGMRASSAAIIVLVLHTSIGSSS